jgi:hypothetical protein
MSNVRRRKLAVHPSQPTRKFDVWRLVAIAAIGLAVWLTLFVVVPYANIELDVDKCLDAGGSYNYETDTCVAGAKR